MVAIRNIMRTKVVTVDPNASLYTISKILSNNQIGSVVVLDKKKPVRLVTEKDIVHALAHDKDLKKTKAKDLKKKPLVSANSSEDMLAVARKMVKSGVKRLPVIDGGRLVGIVSEKEILLAAPELIEVLSEKLKSRLDRVAEPTEAISGLCEKCGDYSDDLRHAEGRWLCEDCRNEEGEY